MLQLICHSCLKLLDRRLIIFFCLPLHHYFVNRLFERFIFPINAPLNWVQMSLLPRVHSCRFATPSNETNCTRNVSEPRKMISAALQVLATRETFLKYKLFRGENNEQMKENMQLSLLHRSHNNISSWAAYVSEITSEAARVNRSKFFPRVYCRFFRSLLAVIPHGMKSSWKKKQIRDFSHVCLILRTMNFERFFLI